MSVNGFLEVVNDLKVLGKLHEGTFDQEVCDPLEVLGVVAKVSEQCANLCVTYVLLSRRLSVFSVTRKSRRRAVV